MDKFAVIFLPDAGERVIKNHPVLKRLPKKVAKKCLPYLSAQKTGLILDKGNQEDLGFLIDVPGFFIDWDLNGEDSRLNIVRKLAKSLKKWNCPVLGFPLFYHYLNEEECILLENEGIILLDGFHHHLAGLLLVVKQLLLIAEKDVPQFEIGVWGADTDIGQVWVEYMASVVNRMCIGGHNYRELEELSDFILKSTGLACQITTKPEVCMRGKDLTIIADNMDASSCMRQTGLHIYSLPEYKLSGQVNSVKRTSNSIQWHPIDMAWMNLPRELKADQELHPYEQLGVMATLFYSISSVYREGILNRRITLDRMNQLHSLYKLLDLKPQGFVRDGQRIHFDRFRREYFAKNELDKSSDYNYNTREQNSKS